MKEEILYTKLSLLHAHLLLVLLYVREVGEGMHGNSR